MMNVTDGFCSEGNFELPFVTNSRSPEEKPPDSQFLFFALAIGLVALAAMLAPCGLNELPAWESEDCQRAPEATLFP